MKKNLIPTNQKRASLKTIILSAFALFTFSHYSFAQCCATLTSAKTCPGKNTGSATITPCIPGNYTFIWDDPSSQTGPTATGLAAGIYHVVMAGTNCPAFEVTVIDSSCTPFSVPNIITPNGDGINDQFVIRGLEPGTQLTVYNRWGDVIYTSNNYNNDWTASNLTNGVYFYVLNLPTTEITKSKKDLSRGFVHILTSN